MISMKLWLRTGHVFALVALLVLTAFAVGDAPPITPPPATEPAELGVSFEFAFYLLTPARSSLDDQLHGFLGGEFKDFTLQPLGAPPRPPVAPNQPPPIFLRSRNIPFAEYAPPDTRFLKMFGRGITDEQAAQLQHASSAWAIDVHTSTANAAHAVHRATELMAKLAAGRDVLLWDEETREIFSPKAWEERRLTGWRNDVPDIRCHIVQHIYRPKERQLPRMITLGMSKFGSPDVVVTDVPSTITSSMTTLVNLACQTMVETPDPLPVDAKSLSVDLAKVRNKAFREDVNKTLLKGATGKGVLPIGPAKRDEGDPHNRLIELRFDDAPAAERAERQYAVIATFFGSADATGTFQHDAELLAARDRARAQMPEVARRLNAGLAPGDHILVKAPFVTTHGTNEWMWVEVLKWDGERITGLLDNDPADVPSLKAGSRVTVKQADLFDYLFVHADGKMEGGETSKILANREAKEKK